MNGHIQNLQNVHVKEYGFEYSGDIRISVVGGNVVDFRRFKKYFSF